MTTPAPQPAAPQPAPPLTEAEDKQWASFAHFGGVLGILPALIIWLIFKDRGALEMAPVLGIATMTVGAVTSADQVNTLLAAGKADLVALARPHLANPYFTLQASAWYQHAGQHWPAQYLSGRDQAFRNAARERAELTDLKLRARPDSHEVKDTGVKKAA